jgi:hypothetical protein
MAGPELFVITEFYFVLKRPNGDPGGTQHMFLFFAQENATIELEMMITGYYLMLGHVYN